MPIYEYKCGGCGEVFEVMQKRTDPAPTHEACGSKKVQRVMSASAFILKGDGWYVTDYARKGKKDGGSESKSDSSATTTKSDKKSEGATA
jgi:putative FmdB family regulatory protein